MHCLLRYVARAPLPQPIDRRQFPNARDDIVYLVAVRNKIRPPQGKPIRLEADPSGSRSEWKQIRVEADPSGSRSEWKPIQVETIQGETNPAKTNRGRLPLHRPPSSAVAKIPIVPAQRPNFRSPESYQRPGHQCLWYTEIRPAAEQPRSPARSIDAAVRVRTANRQHMRAQSRQGFLQRSPLGSA